MKRLLARLSSFRFIVIAATSVVAGTTFTIVDASRQNDCRDSMTWLGYIGWTLVAVGSLPNIGPVVFNHPLADRRSLIPTAVAVLALCVCVGLAFVRLWLRSFCGIDLAP